MRKFSPYIIILVVIVGLFTPTHVAHASWWNPLTWIDGVPLVSDMFNGFITIAMGTIVGFLSFFLWLSGQMLDMTLNYTIIDMSARIEGGVLSDGTTATAMTGINVAWRTIRDVMNILFIFFLLYEAVLLIIGVRQRDKVGKFVGFLVLSALLINFSLFFTKVLIDASNVVTIGIYNSILGPRAGERDLLGFPYGLSNPIVRNMGVTRFYSGFNPFDDQTTFRGKGSTDILIMGLGTSLIIVVACFVFFVVSILFLIRYLILIILLMLSPVAFMGMAFPAMKKYSDDWWDSLKGQLLFPPLYMILTWVVLTLIGSAGFTTNVLANDPTLAIGNKSPGSVSLIINFILVAGLLIASLIIAKKTASQGAKMIGEVTKNATVLAGGAVMGGAARLGRNTAGRWGAGALDDEELKKKAAEGNVRARIQLAAADKFSKASFDVRGAPGIGGLAKTTGVDLGKYDPKKDNFAAIKKAQAEKYEERAKLYKPNDAKYENAKKQDEQARKEAQEKQKNKAWEAETNAHFNSAEWKNTAEGKAEAEALKAKEDAEKAKQNLTDDQTKLADLQKKLDTNTIIGAEVQIKEDMEKLRSEIATKQKGTADLQKLADEKSKAIDVANEARKKYSADAKVAIDKVANKDYKGAEEALNKTYQDRVDNMARRVTRQPELDGNGNPIPGIGDRIQSKADNYGLGGVVGTARKTGGAVSRASTYLGLGTFVGGVANVVSGGTINMPNSRTDREAYARKIKGVVKGKKSAKDLVDDLLKETGEKKDEAPAAAPEPTPPATPETPTT